MQASNAINQSAGLQPSQQLVSVLTAPQTFTRVYVPIPDPEPDEVLVQVEGCGVCASSLSVWEGRPWFQYPLSTGSPGHEPWGRVVACGLNVTRFQPGDRVAFLSEAGYAQFAIAKENHTVAIPEALAHMPFPGEAIGCAINIFRRANIQTGQHVAIIGAGFLGLMLVQLACAAGAVVHILSRREYARELALEFGAASAWDTEDWWGNARKVTEKTGGRGCARVIEVTGLQFALDAATEMISEYGRLVIGGFHQDGLRQINMQTWNWRAIDVINAHERSPARYIEGIQGGINAALIGAITPHKLLTHQFSITQLNQAFTIMAERPAGFIKGWIKL